MKKVFCIYKMAFLACRCNSTGFEHIKYAEYLDPTAPKERNNGTSDIDGNNARRNHLGILFHFLLRRWER
jgi:hypothetical protein